MAGAFANLLPAYDGPRDLKTDEVQKIMGLKSGPGVDNKTSSNAWYDPNYTTDDPRGWMVDQSYGYDFAQGDGGENVRNTTKDQTFIRKLRPDTAGKLGDYWTPDGRYQGTYEAQDAGGRQFNQAALMFGSALGGNLYMANSAPTAGGAVTGLADGASLDMLYGTGATGGGTGGLSAAELAAYSPEFSQTAYTGATGLTPAAPSTPGWLSTLKDAYGAGGEFLNSGWGKLLTTGAGLALTKDAKQGPADPMLQEGSKGLIDISKDAKTRAGSNDELFNREFLPRYLAMMGRADARDQELYDFNMGRARLAAGQMDKFYGAVDAYDNEAARERMAGEAGATAEQQSSAAMNQLMRNMQRKGVNPNSGVMISNMRQQGQAGALGKALAMNMTREAARREGLNMRATAAGLRGADSAYAGNALQGAGLGLSSVNSANSGVNANNASWNSTMGLGANALGQLGGWGLSRSNSADQLSAANTAGWNGLIGYGLGSLWNSGTRAGG